MEDEEEEEGGDMTSMVRRLVLDQHRTMFYTATLSPVAQHKQYTHTKQPAAVQPSLKVCICVKYFFNSQIFFNVNYIF